MSWAKFTPGPWSAKIERIAYPECDDADLPAVVRDARGVQIAWIAERYDSEDVYQHDAALIATAPEMFDVLSLLRAALAEMDAELHAQNIGVIDLTLARARGES